LSLKHGGARTLLFISTAPIAILANVARVFVSAVLAYAVSVDVTIEPVHTLMGLLVFVVAFILMAIVAVLVRRIFE
jgi:exosortase/archaeosortase family protein